MYIVRNLKTLIMDLNICRVDILRSSSGLEMMRVNSSSSSLGIETAIKIDVAKLVFGSIEKKY